jgi:hypothetical protein
VRRFSLRALRDFGFGKKVMEGKIMDEVKELLTELRPSKDSKVSSGKQGKGVNLFVPISTAVANVILNLVASELYYYIFVSTSFCNDRRFYLAHFYVCFFSLFIIFSFFFAIPCDRQKGDSR